LSGVYAASVVDSRAMARIAATAASGDEEVRGARRRCACPLDWLARIVLSPATVLK
jgi:hypothetical protein